MQLTKANTLHNDADGLVGTQIVHNCFVRKVEVAKLGFEKSRIIVVGNVSAVVHIPMEGSSTIVTSCDGEVECDIGLLDCYWVFGDGEVQRLVVAGQREVNTRVGDGVGSVGKDASVGILIINGCQSIDGNTSVQAATSLASWGSKSG